MTTIAGTVLAISQVSLGDVLAADATAGDTTITVDDAADFAEGGGTILIGGQLDDYTSVDDETGVMVLVDALNADALQGDRVDLADPSGSAALEWQALVAPQGTVDTDEAIQATISYAIIPLLPEGIRDPGTGESVTLTRDGTEWQVTNVHGEQPTFDSDNLRGAGPSRDRLTMSWSTNDIVSDQGQITSWGGYGSAFDQEGDSIQLSDPVSDDGRLYLFGEGLYCVTVQLTARTSESASNDQAVAAVAQVSDRPDSESFACVVRGGDPHLHDTGSRAVSTTFYSQGRGLAGGGIKIYVQCNGSTVSADVGQVIVLAIVQKIAGF